MKQLQELCQQTAQHVARKKGEENFKENQTYKNKWLTHTARKPNAIIKPKVCNLIRKNVTSGQMSITQATQAFKVSHQGVQRIIREDPNNVKTFKKQPSKLTDNMKTDLLIQLEVLDKLS